MVVLSLSWPSDITSGFAVVCMSTPRAGRKLAGPGADYFAEMSEVSSHSFRKTVATLIDDAGLSARIGADHLSHAKVSMTQDRYMSRGRVHHQVAELLEQTVSDDPRPDISGE
jgi:integrase